MLFSGSEKEEELKIGLAGCPMNCFRWSELNSCPVVIVMTIIAGRRAQNIEVIFIFCNTFLTKGTESDTF